MKKLPQNFFSECHVFYCEKINSILRKTKYIQKLLKIQTFIEYFKVSITIFNKLSPLTILEIIFINVFLENLKNKSDLPSIQVL